MQRSRLIWTFSILAILLLLTSVSTHAAPLAAYVLPEGRTYDQGHNFRYIDWSGSAQYVFITHRDGTSLPIEEGGTYCGSGCSEWVTRLGNGGSASGSFDRNVSYFEVMVEFTPEGGVGTAVLKACSASMSWYLYNNTSLPGYVSMILAVPSGCRSWSLTASGGFVDFRSIDVEYSGPPNTATPAASRTPTIKPTKTRTPTATRTPTFAPTITRTPTPTTSRTPTFTHTVTYSPTSTFTPSLTPTMTFTPTMMFTPTATSTPTATFTNTPSHTPTPLPPQITGIVVCDLWGDAGWCRGNETLQLTASDPQGFDVTITGDLNGIPFTCGNSCDLPLQEGIGIANYIVTSTSGRTASGSSTWQRDGTSPEIVISLPSVDGRNGWYVSEVDLSATATDLISGLSILNGSSDNGMSWVSFPIHFTDGDHQALIHARDVAGNEVTVSRRIRVDTISPVVQMTSHTNGDVAQGDVKLFGSLEDITSGPEGGEISVDDGSTWEPVLIQASGWSFIWHSSEVPNGDYTIQLRGTDRAGNESDISSLTLTVDNAPPAVSITERWWIWETGTLKVAPNHFPIATIQLTIRDPQKRWQEMVLDFDPRRNSYVVKWDRRFGNGTLAPAGEYPVLAVACDVNGLCGQDAGRILIPEMATSTATMTPPPTVTSTLMPSKTPVATQILPTPTLVLTTPVPEEQPEPAQPTLPLWQIIGLLGLFMVIASASVVDPRPKALERLGETFKVLSAQKKDDSLENKK